MAGERTTFEVAATGVGPLSYQWMKNGERIDGATSALYTAPVAAADDSAEYNVIVENWVTTVSSDVATLRVLPPNVAQPAAFPISVSSNGRYLADTNHKPFRIQGEAAWSLFSNLTYAEADTYLSNRRAKSFNTVLVNLIEHKHAQGGKGADQSGVPKNRNGALPFVRRSGGGAYDGTWGTADFSTPNDEYFAFADSIIDLAADKGILVDLYPMFLGFDAGDAGWWADLTNKTNTRAVAYKFGEYVGQRYKDRKNIIWTIGGDFFPPPRSEGEARLLKFMEGVKAGGANQPWSGDWSAPSLSTDEPAFEASMDLNAVYTYGLRHHPGSTYHEAKAAYTYWPARPAFLKETGYEDEKISPGDAASVRMYEYYAILGGATAGAFFGNRDVWKFNSENWWLDPSTFGHGSWTAAMESAGTFDFVYLGRLLDSVPWYKLVPSGLAGMKKLVSAGSGFYGTKDYVVAAAASDGEVLLAYIPPMRKSPAEITVDMTALAGPARGRWFDPVSGNYVEVPGGEIPNLATKTFTTPGANSSGQGDWVLVLQTKSK
jgi:hypothetical protein